jgi:hypothetical protein
MTRSTPTQKGTIVTTTATAYHRLRRSLTTTGVLLTVLLGLVIGAEPAQATVAGPVGRWTTTVSIPGRPNSTVTLQLFASHSLTITGPPAADGHPAYVGAGLWNNRDQFSFTVIHPLPGADGVPIGIIHGIQHGTLTGDTFATEGVSYLYKPDGTVTGPNPVTMAGLRVSAGGRLR